MRPQGQLWAEDGANGALVRSPTGTIGSCDMNSRRQIALLRM